MAGGRGEEEKASQLVMGDGYTPLFTPPFLPFAIWRRDRPRNLEFWVSQPGVRWTDGRVVDKFTEIGKRETREEMRSDDKRRWKWNKRSSSSVKTTDSQCFKGKVNNNNTENTCNALSNTTYTVVWYRNTGRG